MSSPYGGGGYEPYAGGPHRAPEPEGPPAGEPAPYRRTPQDPVSITAFVLSLLWCTSLVGLVLGIVGLGRTKGGGRRGRWAAVAATVLGAIGTVTGLGVIAFFTWFGVSTIQVGNADVGQCANVDPLSGGDDAILYEKDCGEEHDAEIAAVREFTEDVLADYTVGVPESVCGDLPDRYLDALATGDYDLGFVVDETEPGDGYLCLLEAPPGERLDAPVGG